MDLSLLPLITDTIEPSPSSPGIQGHGEGVLFGQASYSKSKSHYFYRFAGKMMPKDQVFYVTCEEAYFSRLSGDKKQLIMAFDEIDQGFRVLAYTRSGSGEFKATYEKYKQYSTTKEAMAEAQRIAKEQKAIADNIRAAIERGDDIF